MDSSYLYQLGNGLSDTEVCKEVYQDQVHLADRIWDENEKQISKDIDKLIPQQVSAIQEAVPENKVVSSKPEILADVLNTQMETIVFARRNILTAGIDDLMRNFRHGLWGRGMHRFLTSLTTPGYNDAAEVMLLKDVQGLEDFVEGGYPSSVKDFIKEINARTAKRLSQNDKIEANIEEQSFRPNYSSEAVVNMETMNVIASSTELLSGIPEDELMVFQDELDKYPELAMRSPTAEKIRRIIATWHPLIGFDQQCYFHSREREQNGRPFTTAEMGKAPNEKAPAGRYNREGQSHYYFCNTKEGSECEVKKHRRDSLIQTARLWPKKEIRMIDLSEEISHRNEFLSYLRFDFNDTGEGYPKEYLLPEFVSSCCENAGIEGIKYYGSAEYKNYVSWDDSYFNIELF